MFPFNLFPYTNFHALNLDWIVERFKRMILTINGYSPDENGNITLTGAELGAVASVDGIAPDTNGNVAINAVKTVNGFAPDANGNVFAGNIRLINGIGPTSLPTPGSVTLRAADVGAVGSVNNQTPDNTGNVNVGTVRSVNNQAPDINGNVNLSQVSGVTSVNGVGADGSGNVTLTPADVGALSASLKPVLIVNTNITPDQSGNLTLDADDVGALPDSLNPVLTVNTNISPDQSGDLTLDADDVGAVKRYTDSGTVTWNNTNTDPTYSNIDSQFYVMDNICFVTLRFQAASALSGGMELATGLPLRATGSTGYMTAISTNPVGRVGRVQATLTGALAMGYSGAFSNGDVIIINGCYPVDPSGH